MASESSNNNESGVFASINAMVKNTYNAAVNNVYSYKNKHKDSDAIKFLDKMLNRMDIILKAFDKLLKSKGIDVGKIANNTKDKGKKALDNSLAAASSVKNNIKSKGLVVGLKASGNSVLKWAKKTLTGNTSPPEGQSEDGEKPATEPPVAETTIAPKKPSIWEKLNSRMSRRKKEIEDEKNGAKIKDKKESTKDGWVSKILGGLVTLGGFIVGKLGSVLGTVAGTLGGFLLKGLGGMFTKLIPGLSGGIAKALQSMIWKLIKGGAGLAWDGAKALVKSTVVRSGAMAIARGAAMLIPGVAVSTVAVGATYGAWKAYKYFTRNNIDDNIYGKLTRVRLLSYGLNDASKEHYHKLLGLEMLLKDVIKYRDRSITIGELSTDITDEICDLFGFRFDESTKVDVWRNWYSNRFIPVFKAHLNALYSVNSTLYIDEINKLKKDNLFKFASFIETPVSIYDVKQIPTFPDIIIRTTKDEVDNTLANVINEIKITEHIDGPSDIKPTPPPTSPVTIPVKPNGDKPHVPAQPKPPVNTPAQFGAESEKVPSSTVIGLTPDSSTYGTNAGKLNMASGGLVTDTGDDFSLVTLNKATGMTENKLRGVHPDVKNLFLGMSKEYNDITDKKIIVNDGFRAKGDEHYKPGSFHSAGLALDIQSDVANELDKLGLMRKYGFTRSIAGEPWHIEPAALSAYIDTAKEPWDSDKLRNLIAQSPSRGGGGLGAPENTKKGQTPHSRDVVLQKSIFNNGAASEVIAKTEDKKKEYVASLPAPNKQKSANIPEKPKQQAKDNSAVITQPPVNKTPISPIINNQQANTSSDSERPPEEIAKNAPVMSFKEAAHNAAKLTGVSEISISKFSELENFSENRKGLFQIPSGKFAMLLKQHGDNYGLPKDAKQSDNYVNAIMVAEYIKHLTSQVPNYRISGLDNIAVAHLVHRYGPDDAIRIITGYRTNPAIDIKDYVSKGTYSKYSNELSGKFGSNSIGAVISNYRSMTNTSPTESYASSKDVKPTQPITTSSVNLPATTDTTKVEPKADTNTVNIASYGQAYTIDKNTTPSDVNTQMPQLPISPIPQQQQPSVNLDTTALEGNTQRQIDIITAQAEESRKQTIILTAIADNLKWIRDNPAKASLSTTSSSDSNSATTPKHAGLAQRVDKAQSNTSIDLLRYQAG